MNATIDIKKADGTALVSVVVNEGSVRHYELMQEDYIRIKFSLVSPVDFKLGCYADIADMGRFVVTDKITTSYNTSTGGYDYELKLDAQYMRWRNKLMKFLPQIGCREVSWSLTATAEVHLEQIVANVNRLGASNAAWYKYNGTTDWECSVSSDIDANMAKSIDYDGINILDALSAIAEAFDTEWYVEGNTIYLGKCQDNDEEPLVISLGDSRFSDSAASMSRNDSKIDRATRIYPYGSDKNIPSKYRKELVLDALSVTGNGTRFSDTAHKMLGGYFATIISKTQIDYALNDSANYRNLNVCNDSIAPGAIFVDKIWRALYDDALYPAPRWNSIAHLGSLRKGSYYLDFTNFVLRCLMVFRERAGWSGVDFMEMFDCRFYVEFGTMNNGTFTSRQTIVDKTITDGSWGEFVYNQSIDSADTTIHGYRFESTKYISGLNTIQVTDEMLGNNATLANCAVVVHLQFTPNSYRDEHLPSNYTIITLSYSIKAWGAKSDIAEAHFSEVYPRIKAQFDARLMHYVDGVATSSDLTGLTFNPDMEQDTYDEANVIQLPSGTTISQGDKIYIPDAQVTTDVPASYYSPKYNLEIYQELGDDAEQVIKSGVVDNRLMLPESATNPFVQTAGITDEEAIEQIVVFDDIYPHQVSSIGEIDANHTTTDKQENDDNTVTSTKYPEYWFRLNATNEETTTTNGVTNTSDVSDPLYNFNPKWALATLEVTFQSGMLNGFTFEVEFNPKGELVFDDENNVNRESQWWRLVRNSDLNIPNEILRPEIDDKFVLTGIDASKVGPNYVATAESRLLSIAEQYLEEISRDDNTYNCSLMSDVAADLIDDGEIYLGRRVTLYNPAYFSSNGRLSRIIGYEMKLDIPFDTPTLIIGDEAQYSRLGEIEEKINVLAMGIVKYRKGETIFGGTSVSGKSYSGGNIPLLTTESETPESDETAYSSLRTSSDYVSKKREEAIQLPMSFYGGVVFGVYVAGESGTKIGSDGAIITNVPLTAKNISASGNVSVAGDITADNITATGDITAVDIIGADFYATNNAYITGSVSADSATITTTLSAAEVDATDIIATNVYGNTKVQGALIKGTTKVNTPLVEATTKVNTPLVEATTKVQTPLAEATEVITTSVKTSDFNPDPLVGVGFGIYKDTQLNNATKAVVDYLTVRKGMKVAVLEIAEYRSVNGGLVLSPANGTIKNVTTALAIDGTNYVCDLKGDSNTFVVGDLVRCQRWDMSITPTDPLKYYWLEVTAVNQSSQSRNSITIFVPTGYSGMTPAADDVIVQMGNTDSINHADRQGFVIITDDGMSVYNGVNSTSLTGKLKSKFGNLNNVVFNGNSLSGYGLFGESVYLKGSFVLNNSKTVETYVTEGDTAAVSEAEGYAKNYTDGRETTIRQDFVAADGVLSSTISKVSKSSQYNTNLARLTNQGTLGWSYYSSVNNGRYTLAELDEGVAFTMLDSPFATNQQQFGFKAPFAKTITSGKKYVISAELLIHSTDGSRSISARLGVAKSVSSSLRAYTASSYKTIIGIDKWEKQAFQITANYTSEETDLALVAIIHVTTTSLSYIGIRNLKVEEGEVDTIYSPAPEDLDDEFSEVRSEISQTAENISLSVVESVIAGEATILGKSATATTHINQYRYFEPYSWLTFDGTLTAGKNYRLVLLMNIASRWAGKQLYIYPESTSHSWQYTFQSSDVGQIVEIEIPIQNYTSPASITTYRGEILLRLMPSPPSSEDYDWHDDNSQLLAGYLYEDNGQPIGSLKQTGIDIRRGVIELTANNVVAKNSLGQPTAMLDANGKLETNIIKADELDTSHLIARNSQQQIVATVNASLTNNNGTITAAKDNSGAYRIYYPGTAQTKLEMKDEIRNEDEPDEYVTTMRMFDTNGNILWELGTDALTKGFTNPSLSIVRLVLGGSSGIDEETEAKTGTIFEGENFTIRPDTSDPDTGVIYDALADTYYDVYFTAEKDNLQTTYTRDKYVVTQDQQTGVLTYVKTQITWYESNITLNPHNN